MMDAVLRRVRPDQVRELTLIVVLVAMIAFFAIQIPNYLSPRTFTNITTGSAIIATVAVGQVLVLLTRNVDLSVGSIVGLVAYTVGNSLAGMGDVNPVIVILLCMAMGAALGAINGAIVAYGRVPAIIATLGTLALFRTGLVVISGSKTVTTDKLPDWLVSIPSTSVITIAGIDIRVLFGIALVATIVGQVVLRYLPYGRRLFAIGSNPDAARVAGLPIRRDVFFAFVGSGMMAGIGGFMWLGKFGNITVVSGSGLELEVVAAAVVGGVNIFGGAGSMFGALLGALLIQTLQTSLLRWLGISQFALDAVLGALILFAVAADAIILRRMQEAWVRVRRQDDARARASRDGEAARGT
ncbi:MAG: ABC transporter permease [Chloroflexi bacterium]|nr:ABC transporter permease [Chloroflexota bacterium]